MATYHAHDVIERRVREVSTYISNVPVLTFRVSNVPARIKLMIEYEKIESDQPSLLFDYVLGKHKAIPIPIRDLLPLPRLFGVRILFTTPKKYDNVFTNLFGEIDNDNSVYELAGIVKLADRHVYFIKPDFITDNVKGQKSPRRIPFRYGFIRLVLRIENADGTIDRIKLAETEVFWIRHGEPCSTVAYIVRKSTGNAKEAQLQYKRCMDKLDEKVRMRDNWALLLIHRRYRIATGRWHEEWVYRLYNFVNTNAYKLPDKVRFGNQSFEVVDYRKYRDLIEEDLGVHYKWELQPYAHSFTAWFTKSRAKKKGKGEITVKPFHVYRLRSDTGEVRYLIVPEREMVRLVVVNKHHWREGWGRLFIELRRGAKRIDALLVRHKKLYPKIEAFLP